MVKINWIEFENLETGLKCERVDFNDDITLLVGVSGAGKTQIIKTIKLLFEIASMPYHNVRKMDGINAKISFMIDENNYIWEIKTNKISDCLKGYNKLNFEKGMEKSQGKIEYEKLTCNKNDIFTRTDNKIDFIGYTQLPVPDSETSLIFQYRNDNNLYKVSTHLNKLYQFYNDIPLDDFGAVSFQDLMFINQTAYFKKAKKFKNNKLYVSHFPSNWSPVFKAYFLQETNHNIFNKVIKLYRNIFSDIIDIKVQRLKNFDSYTIFFDTQDASIEFKDMSSGMQKTFVFLLDLYTVSSDYVFVIDEIENSLGINCLDKVCEAIQYERDDLQFIITSHHPYIINQIDMDAWKIVKRNKNIIFTSTPESEGLLESRHEAFDKLQNLLKYGDMK